MGARGLITILLTPRSIGYFQNTLVLCFYFSDEEINPEM